MRVREGTVARFGPDYFQTEAEQLDDLARDLRALGLPRAQATLAEFPALLRRCAHALAARLPTGPLRAIAVDESAAALAEVVGEMTEPLDVRSPDQDPGGASSTGSRGPVYLICETLEEKPLLSALARLDAARQTCAGVLAVVGGGAPPQLPAQVLFPELAVDADAGWAGPWDAPRQAPRLLPHQAEAERISEDLTRFAALSEGGEGVTRLAYSPLEREAHAVFAARMRELGLRVRTDAAGNTIAELPGSGTSRAIGTGSHLDSVPRAGRFDGIAGVVAAMEAARLLTRSGAAHHHALRFVAFAGEEGARFGTPCLGSKFAAGALPAAVLKNVDVAGVSLAAAMSEVGLSAEQALREPWDTDDWAAFVELHVEQGAVLETQGIGLGVVDTVSGSTRLAFTLRGRASHSGGTPMELRADALTAAAELVLHAERVAQAPGYEGTRATVGRLEVEPGSITTIPGAVTMTLDIRDTDAHRQRVVVQSITRHALAVCELRGVLLDVEDIGDTSPVMLPRWLGRLASEAASALGLTHTMLTSGASHDSQIINRIAPSAILFVPSRGGLSHVPDEWTSSDDIARGTDALVTTLLAADDHLNHQERERT